MAPWISLIDLSTKHLTNRSDLQALIWVTSPSAASIVQISSAKERQMPGSLSNAKDAENSHKSSLVEVNVADIVSVSPCADLTLPAGPALCVDTVHGSFYLVKMLNKLESATASGLGGDNKGLTGWFGRTTCGY
ncbi:hypothetical protein POM88_027959 [Heracleum sosnowskyi]|uniref:Uncharacterized protein n=1 Tax=Heracleum sosnowskyi TaxID=360622 RepID=A0AAD8I9A6_9APIA|nr:hypothetical protein POM88_027959 [Heracleum sosnowskyi]